MALKVDPMKCTGCRVCIRKCPYASPSMYPGEKFVIICDLCGGNPRCVAACEPKALGFVDPHNLHVTRMTESAAKLFGVVRRQVA